MNTISLGVRLSSKELIEDTLALIGDEGRIKRRNASVSCKKALT